MPQQNTAFHPPHSQIESGEQPPKKKKTSKIHTQRLSPRQESFLADWILNEEGAGRAPSRRQSVAFAQEILAQGGNYRLLGLRWIDRFLRRNNKIKAKPGIPVKSARARGSTRTTYEDFYARLQHQLQSKSITPRNITNMDGHGMQEVETRAGTVLGDSLTPRALLTSSDDTT
jgi:4-hydroxybenzoate polyprenyltransferase